MTDTNTTASNNDGNSNNSFPFWKIPLVGTGLLQKFVATPILASPPIRTRESLPAPPNGMEWILSGNDAEKKEWRLIKATTSETTNTTKADSPSEPELITEQEDTEAMSKAGLASSKVSTELSINNKSVATTSGMTSIHNIIDQSSLLSLLKPPLLPSSTRQQNIQNRNTSSIGSGTSENQQQQGDDAWELLSDRISTSSNQTPSVILHYHNYAIKTPSSGSVRSLSSMENNNDVHHNSSILSSIIQDNSYNHNVPFKIQRTTSSSTIDSSEQQNAAYIGPLGKGVLGVDYVEHVILPTDTLQGICIAYKVTSTQLRLANNFSGNSLLLAPSKLVIPLSKKALRSGYIRVQDTDQKEYKIHALLAEFPDFSMTEAKAYLELADWTLKNAIRSAKDDHEWEVDNDEGEHHGNIFNNNNIRDGNSNSSSMKMIRNDQYKMFKSGEIRITPKLNETGKPIGFHTKGAGIVQQQSQEHDKNDTTTNQTTATTIATTNNINDVMDILVRSNNLSTSALAMTTENHQHQQHQDIYAQHNSFGVELQAFSKKSSP